MKQKKKKLSKAWSDPKNLQEILSQKKPEKISKMEQVNLDFLKKEFGVKNPTWNDIIVYMVQEMDHVIAELAMDIWIKGYQQGISDIEDFNKEIEELPDKFNLKQ